MFEMTPEGRKRVDRNDAVRQTVPEFGSSNRESPATDSRQLDLPFDPSTPPLNFTEGRKCKIYLNPKMGFDIIQY